MHFSFSRKCKICGNVIYVFLNKILSDANFHLHFCEVVHNSQICEHFRENHPTLSVFAKLFVNITQIFVKSAIFFILVLAFGSSFLRIFSLNCSGKQLFWLKSAEISCHQNIFTKIVLLIHMELIDLSF
jgi:hypothetical protein